MLFSLAFPALRQENISFIPSKLPLSTIIEVDNSPKVMSTSDPRTPKLVIDQAIRENRFPEKLSYVFASTFVVMGVVSFVWLMCKWEPVLTVITTISSACSWPAMNSARDIRRQNIAIRLMEIPLSRAENASSAASILEEFFSSAFSRNT